MDQNNYTVGYIIGSLSAQSINRTLSKALIRLAPEKLRLAEIPIADLPLYNRDFDVDFPPAASAFKAAIAAVDAVLFVTPEYNRSIPGSLKNAIDWASRPWKANSFASKPSAVIGASPGPLGTAVAQHNLRSILNYCNSPQMGDTEAYIHMVRGLITDDGLVTDKRTEEFLRDYMKSLETFIARVVAGFAATADVLHQGPSEVRDATEPNRATTARLAQAPSS